MGIIDQATKKVLSERPRGVRKDICNGCHKKTIKRYQRSRYDSNHYTDKLVCDECGKVQ